MISIEKWFPISEPALWKAKVLNVSGVLFVLAGTLLEFPTVAASYRDLGYAYLSPEPEAEYMPPQTRYVLVRFMDFAPTEVTNLVSFITVTGTNSGLHAGTTRIAGDGRTVIFQMTTDFASGELVRVTLDPRTTAGAGTIQPFQYRFVAGGSLKAATNMPPGVITARGENPPNETKEKAFDGLVGTKWLDFMVPNGTGNFSWIQLLHPDSETSVVSEYALTSANDAPERDPRDWRLYGVDGSSNLVLLDTRSGQTFSSRFQRRTFTFSNAMAYRGYRLEITRVANPSTANSVQLSEIEFIQAGGIAQPGSDDVAGGSDLPGRTSGNDEGPLEGPPPGPQPGPPPAVTPGKPGIMPNGVSVPSDFPHINITINDNPDQRYIFLDNRRGGNKPYNIIFDNDGFPVWYQRMPDERRDMKVQPNGMLTMLAQTGGYRFEGLNSNYVHVATYPAVNGYSTDDHELIIQPDGTYLLIGLRYNTVDMSQYVPGGNPAANVGETVIQEFTAAGELIFQWRSWDHYDIRDQRVENLTGSSMRFPHMNALDIDTDGHILVSCRNLSEVTKINRFTGEIIWRLGGAHSDFTFSNDALNGFEIQHSIRHTGTNRYILFDNGVLHSPPVSRGVEYQLDLTNRTATVVWQFRQSPDVYSHYMGNVQRLTNGNTLINWAIGSLPKLTEVRPNGTKAFEMNWLNQYETYRVWRCDWQGMALKPNLIAESYPEQIVLLFNKFGDPTVDYYKIYGGTNPNPSEVLAVATSTMIYLRNLQNQSTYYFRATAVSTNGIESDASDEVSVFVDMVQPGQNMVKNGDFAGGATFWSLSLSGAAAATWGAAGGAGFIDISSPGSQTAEIQLWQSGIKLVQGREYVMEFDAWSTAPRLIDARLGQSQSPWAVYKLAYPPYPSLTPVKQHFRYVFTMLQPTDLNSRLTFNVGGSTADVYIDNISVSMLSAGDYDQDGCIGFDDLKTWSGLWLGTGASDLNADGLVDFGDFSVLGENWSGTACP